MDSDEEIKTYSAPPPIGQPPAAGKDGGEPMRSAAVAPALVRLAVIDDNTFYRDWLGQAGTLPAHQHVVARAANAAELVAVLGQLPDRRCDVVLLDLRIVPDLQPDPAIKDREQPAAVIQGTEAIRLLLRVGVEEAAAGMLARPPAVLVYTQEAAPRVHVACLLAGASGVIHKSESLNRLGEGIDVAAGGGVVVDERTARLIEALAKQRRLDLTQAQEAVLALAAHGWTRRRIARQLSCAESTIDKHLSAIRDAFGDVTLVDLADAFGLRDLAPPHASEQPAEQGAARFRRLAKRLGRG